MAARTNSARTEPRDKTHRNGPSSAGQSQSSSTHSAARASPSRKQPLWLLVSDFSDRSDQTVERILIDHSNDSELILASKDALSATCKRIPQERRKGRVVLSLPTLNWDSQKKEPAKKRASAIDILVGPDVLSQAGIPGHLKDSAILIPLESKKRKRSDNGSSLETDCSAPKQARSDAPQEERDSERISQTNSRAPAKPQSSNSESVAQRAFDRPGTELPPPNTVSESRSAVSKMTSPPLSSVTQPSTVESKTELSSPESDARTSDCRPESPPMRIVSVRSLADNSSYRYGSLDERILVEHAAVPDVPETDSAPLYIFNPVKPCTESFPQAETLNEAPARPLSRLKVRAARAPTVLNTETPSGETGGEARKVCKTHPAKQTPEPNVPKPTLNCEAISGDSLDKAGRSPPASSASKNNSSHRSEIESISKRIKQEGIDSPRSQTRSVEHIVGNKVLRVDDPDAVPSSRNQLKTVSPDANQCNVETLVAGSLGEGNSVQSKRSDEPIYVLEFDPHSSPFEDSESSDSESKKICVPEDAVFSNFTDGILKELDSLHPSDHSYSKSPADVVPLESTVPLVYTAQQGIPMPVSDATSDSSGQHNSKLLIRFPKNVVLNFAKPTSNEGVLGKRHRKTSSSSTDSSTGVSTKTKTPIRNVAAEMKVRQGDIEREKRVKKSVNILHLMQLATLKDEEESPNRNGAQHRLELLEHFNSHFRKCDFSREPLNRSILNAMAEWLSPLPQGKLPPLRLRTQLLQLINHFTIKTPAHVFQATSVEGVLMLLMNHPKETPRNKSLAWDLVNFWRDD